MPAAEKIDGIEKQTLIQITIENNNIVLYPQRETDAIAYRKPASGPAHPAKPDQIRWVVSGLGSSQEILLETKVGEVDRFSSSSFKIVGSKKDNTVASGKATSTGPWKYNIF